MGFGAGPFLKRQYEKILNIMDEIDTKENVNMPINTRGAAECLGGLMMSVSWHCNKPQSQPRRAAYGKKDEREVGWGGGCKEIVQKQSNLMKS